MACVFARERGQRNRCNSRIEVDFEKSSVNAQDHDERKDDHDETANERDCHTGMLWKNVKKNYLQPVYHLHDRRGIIQKKPKTLRLKAFGYVSGTHGRIRTSGLPLRRRPLYPAELRGHIALYFRHTALSDMSAGANLNAKSENSDSGARTSSQFHTNSRFFSRFLRCRLDRVTP